MVVGSMLYKRKIIVARDWWRVREEFPVLKKCESCCSICFAGTMINIFENENFVIILKGSCCKNSNRKYYYSEKHVSV